jgi:hypothetical protein
MYSIVRNNTVIKDNDGFISNSQGWVIVNENDMRVSALIHKHYGTAIAELESIESQDSKLQDILEEYDLQEMLDTLNDKCGNGKPLTLNEKQAIRFMVEQLNRAMKGIV